jgi:dolichol-phosphate mannosyltransferase
MTPEIHIAHETRSRMARTVSERAATAAQLRADRPLELVVVVPTYCERGNIVELIQRLRRVLAGLSWEVIFVDDDSPDDTADLVRALSHTDRRVRCLQRVGRRGLSSACLEGMLASAAPVIAVMDADLQHDETRLPAMFGRIRDEGADLVIATRYAGDGSTGSWDATRADMSRAATRLSRFVHEQSVSDPMSGFFMLRREVLETALRDLSAVGFKLLLDILATVKEPLVIREEPYTFRNRARGESKLDTLVLWDFGMLLLDKLVGRYVPVRFIAFALVGGAGVAVHMAIICMLLLQGRLSFPAAQVLASTLTMVFNYTINNVLTYRDRRRHRLAWLTGLLSFMAACSLGAFINVVIANSFFSNGAPWMLASLAGILIGAMWNFAVASQFTWQRRRGSARSQP